MAVAPFAFFFRVGRLVWSESALILLVLFCVSAGVFALKVRRDFRREDAVWKAQRKRRDS